MTRGRTAAGRRRARVVVGRRTHQLLLFLHVVASVGWFGAGAANVVLASVAARTASASLRTSSYHLMDAVDVALVIPLAFAALATGVVVSLTTRWGLVRYRWVLVKLVLTLVVIVWSTFGVGVWVEEGIAAGDAGLPNPAETALVWGAGANLVAFLFMSWISVTKPWGLVVPRRLA